MGRKTVSEIFNIYFEIILGLTLIPIITGLLINTNENFSTGLRLLLSTITIIIILILIRNISTNYIK